MFCVRRSSYGRARRIATRHVYTCAARGMILVDGGLVNPALVSVARYGRGLRGGRMDPFSASYRSSGCKALSPLAMSPPPEPDESMKAKD